MAGKVNQELLARTKTVAAALMQNVAEMHRLIFEGDGLAMPIGAERKRIEPLDLSVVREARELYEELRAIRGRDEALEEFVRISVDPEPAAKALLRIHRELSSDAGARSSTASDTDDGFCPLCGGDLPIGADVCNDCREV